nr:unnamed protein product [Callosobruchus chinensis]
MRQNFYLEPCISTTGIFILPITRILQYFWVKVV